MTELDVKLTENSSKHEKPTMEELPPSLDKLIRLGKKGEGVYGIVYSACEKDEVATFAVKRNLIDVTGDFVGSIRELDILVRLNGHPHIVQVNSIAFGDPFIGGDGNVLSPVSDSEYKDDKIHFIFEEAREDGSSYFSDASWIDLKRCMVHLLLAVEFCHEKGVIHRDLKPANLLIFNSPTEKNPPILKVCDFGLSKPITLQGEQTPSVVTSWYRAPEILSYEEYDSKADLWSVGCIFYEMVTKIPLLHGSPDRTEIILSHLSELFPLLKIKADRTLSRRRSRHTWITQLKKKAREHEMKSQGWNMEQFIDLLEHLLCHARERYTATEALDHIFFLSYADYITSTRQKFPPTLPPEPVIKLVKNKERDAACKIVKKIFCERVKYSWYSHRILFQSLSLFDRYLLSDVKKEPLNNKKLRLSFTACLYIAVKYFMTMTSLIPFSVLYGEISDEEKRWTENFEITFLEKVAGYSVYEPTLYEAADLFDEILDDNHTEDLLNIFIDGRVKRRNTQEMFDINGLKPSHVYAYYRGKQ